MTEFKKLIEKGECGNLEFKEKLKKDLHLKTNKKSSLASQLKFRLLEGKGLANYLIGVDDDKNKIGLEKDEFRETVKVIKEISKEVNAEIIDIKEKKISKNKKIGLIKINSTSKDSEHLIVGTAGHVDHGKSSLIGSLVTGEADNGTGKTRTYFDVQPHEIERGLSADLSYGVYGFNKNGEPVKLRNPLSSQERRKIISKCNKIVSFVDTVGHEPWLRTTIRGLVGQKLDYGLLAIAADEGVTHITREHLGILLAMDLPVIVAITKTDLADEKRLNKTLQETTKLLKKVGKVPYKIECREDINTVLENKSNVLIPILKTSAVSLRGISLLDKLLYSLPAKKEDKEKPFKMYIDRIYDVTGVGKVVSGTVMSGKVKEGKEVLLGPTKTGEYKPVKIKSIEMHHHKVERAESGQIVGIALKGIEDVDIQRGMTLVSTEVNPETVREFKADIMVLNHPTKIHEGYEPVIHLETISEAAEFMEIKGDFIVAGDSSEARLRFKFNPHYIYEGQKFIFREGKSKGVGKVKKVIK
ncbi:MAG: GTPase GTPBP1 [Candidatus Methanohalarchaeum thermophilum]|uniref:GTPase GTPBP1 n=1 Tax=Methanohalarchaeum thermophilum TaxID=1903181 RepID=A0A1Q6DW84_METT1|nr:MAG: GTPase GTPBP1 [Candidatus Methanohalarchaeum thermophilum]